MICDCDLDYLCPPCEANYAEDPPFYAEWLAEQRRPTYTHEELMDVDDNYRLTQLREMH